MNMTTALTTFMISINGGAMADTSFLINEDTKQQRVYTSHMNKISYDYSKIYAELESYQQLEYNWDGYNGEKPSTEIINTAKIFLEKLKNEDINCPKVMLAGSGEIAIFWESYNEYIEVSFDLENMYSFFYETSEEIYGVDDLNIGSINKKLHSVLANKDRTNTSHAKPLIVGNEDKSEIEPIITGVA